ncbi:MAG: hypothetical protein ACPG3U_06610, partial [Rhodothermales bacterium]
LERRIHNPEVESSSLSLATLRGHPVHSGWPFLHPGEIHGTLFEAMRTRHSPLHRTRVARCEYTPLSQTL